MEKWKEAERRLFVALWIVAHLAPLSMGFSRQEYWSGFTFPPPEPGPGIEPKSPASPALADRFFYHWATWEARVSGAVFQIMVRKVPNVDIIKKRYIFLNQPSIIWVYPFHSFSFAKECLPYFGEIPKATQRVFMSTL